MSGDTELRLSGYVRELFAAEDELLEALRYELPRRGLPEIQIPAEVARLLQVLLRAIGARRVLEIGTLGGYSAIWMARALPDDGELVTLEIDPEHARFAREFIARAGLEARIEVMEGSADDLLAPLVAQAERDRSARFDAVFIDADKERYPSYLDSALRLVRPGGLIMADNAFWSGSVLDDEPDSDATRGVRELNRRLASDPRLTASIIPAGDGLAVAVVNRGQAPAALNAASVLPT